MGLEEIALKVDDSYMVEQDAQLRSTKTFSDDILITRETKRIVESHGRGILDKMKLDRSLRMVLKDMQSEQVVNTLMHYLTLHTGLPPLFAAVKLERLKEFTELNYDAYLNFSDRLLFENIALYELKESSGNVNIFYQRENGASSLPKFRKSSNVHQIVLNRKMLEKIDSDEVRKHLLLGIVTLEPKNFESHMEKAAKEGYVKVLSHKRNLYVETCVNTVKKIYNRQLDRFK